MDSDRKLRVLVIEDDADIAENIGEYLEGEGHVLDFALDGVGGFHLALTRDYDIIVLDIMLPGMDGLAVCRRLREEGGKRTPVLMLTARDTLEDKLDGFRAGTDDYLVKPFALQELAARIRALARRAREKQTRRLQVADLEMDLGTMEVRRAGQAVSLNRTGMRILALLMEASPNVVSRQDIEAAIWGDALPGSDVLRSHVYAIRNAIDRPFPRALLHTIHGVGYRLAASDDISL